LGTASLLRGLEIGPRGLVDLVGVGPWVILIMYLLGRADREGSHDLLVAGLRELLALGGVGSGSSEQGGHAGALRLLGVLVLVGLVVEGYLAHANKI